MTEKSKEIIVKGGDVAKYLESTDAGVAADKLHELITNISTLVDRIQDLIEEDPLLSAVCGVSFVVAVTTVGKPRVVSMTGTCENILICLNELTDCFKKSNMNKEERRFNND